MNRDSIIAIATTYVSSLVVYALLAIQIYSLNMLYMFVCIALLSISIIVIYKYLFRDRNTLVKLLSIFNIFIYVAAAERSFILFRTLPSNEVSLAILTLLGISLNILMLFYLVLRGSGNKIVKMEYKGYA